MIPPMISEMTRGWRIFERGQFSARQKMMIIPACGVEYQRLARDLVHTVKLPKNRTADDVPEQ